MASPDEVKVHFNPDLMGMNNIGPDQARADSNAINSGTIVNMRSQFGMAHGPGIQTGIQLAPQPQPNDPWANTGPQRNPVLNGVDQVGSNLGAGGPKGAQMSGAGELANSVGAAMVELFGAVTKPEPQTPQFDMTAQPRPQHQPGVFGL